MNMEEMEMAAASNGKEQANKILAERSEIFAKQMGSKTTGILVAEGDSWFDYPGSDIIDMLEDNHGYDVEKVASYGDRIEEMAYTDGQLENFTKRIEKVLRRGNVPKAILLSAGGNDIAGDGFVEFLNHSSAPNRGLNDQVVEEYIDVRIRNAYIHIISSVNKVCVDRCGLAVPIITHGYDYAVPDGRGYLWFGPWLDPAFRKKGYFDLGEKKNIIETLINRFNFMMKSLKDLPDLGHIVHIDLRGTLPNDDTYEQWWDNELHPEEKGFEIIGDMFAQEIANL